MGHVDWNIPFAGGVGMEIHRPGGVEDTIRAAQLLEQLGYVATGYSDQMQSWIFRSIWSPDLVPAAAQVPDYEAFYNTIPLLAAVASHTERIGLSAIVDCYRRSPALLAQELLTLDHISHGRVAIVLGTGENKQFLPYGLERTEPPTPTSRRPYGSSGRRCGRPSRLPSPTDYGSLAASRSANPAPTSSFAAVPARPSFRFTPATFRPGRCDRSCGIWHRALEMGG